MEYFLPILEFLVILVVSLFLALFFLSLITWRPSEEMNITTNKWLLSIETVETKLGTIYLIYNKLNDEFLYQVTNMDDMMPWLVEQLEKNKKLTVAILDPAGNARPIELITHQGA